MGQMQLNQQQVVGLDIGSSKVMAMAGMINEEGKAEVIGIGCAESKGLSRGAVVNIADATQSIRTAIRDLEFMAKIDVESVYVGMTGAHVNSWNSQGISAIKDGVVLADDISRALDPAQVVPTSARTQHVLHILPQEYIIDEQDGLSSPEGMEGTRLEAKVHVVTCDVNIVKNLERCVRKADLSVAGIVQNPLATSCATLSPEEKALGVCLVDIGASTTDIAIYSKGALRFTRSMPLAGREVSNDIALVLQCRAVDAERLKLEYGTSYAKSIMPGEILRMKRPGDGTVFSLDRQLLTRIIEARYREILMLVHKNIKVQGQENNIPAGIVLTGGAVRIEGLKPLAEEIFRKQVRIAKPMQICGLEEIICHPAYSTSTGILLHGMQAIKGGNNRRNSQPVQQRVQQWIDRLF